ncbi:MAG TPA: ATP-binding cassette domain-containing protein, partial [Streptosporangiaceae bacterium]|nr:ATP-binding cassette domain-containing protein [Streptosporangiaceae bacterium]
MTEQIQTPPAPEAGRVAGPDGDTLLQVTDLVRHFPVTRGVVFRRKVGAVQAVDGINLSVARGQTLGLVGESGCGKTTTGRLLVRLDEPTSGQIVIDGHDVTHLRQGQMRPLRREIQMIFQDPYSSLNPRHTVGAIVGAPFRLQGINPPGGIKRAVQE